MNKRNQAVRRSMTVLSGSNVAGIDDLPAVIRSLRILGRDYLSGIEDIDGMRGVDLRYLVDLVEAVYRFRLPGQVARTAEPTQRPALLPIRGYPGSLRTPAVSALVARECAVPGARSALVIGSGPQARMALPFLLTTVPSLEDLRVYGADADGEAVRAHLRAHFPDRDVTVVDDLQAAAGEADVIVAAGEPADPVAVEAGWLRPGALSILVGHGLAPSTLHRADRVLATSDAQLRFTGADMADADGRIPTPDAEFPAVIGGYVAGRTAPAQRIFAYNG